MPCTRPTPMDRAGGDLNDRLIGPREWYRQVPIFACNEVPAHVVLVMDGNGRWANSRGLARIEGHRAGEYTLMDTAAGAIDAGACYLNVYTFSTENWKHNPAEVCFIMSYVPDVLARRIGQLDEWGVHVRRAGRRPCLWKSVIDALEKAEAHTRANTTLDLVMCVNYGRHAEIADVVRKTGYEVAAGRLKPEGITEKSFGHRLYLLDVPDVGLMIRTSGGRRISNYLPWQLAYLEMMLVDTSWPSFDRETLWDCLLEYAGRDRRLGGAVDALGP